MTKALEAAIATCEAHYERPLKNWEITALQAAITAFLANTDGGEIVERLQKWDRCWPGNVNIERMVDDAADHITKLTAQLTGAIADGYDLAKEEYRERIAELEAALEPCAARAGLLDGIWKDHETQWSPKYPSTGSTIGDLRRAARALTAGGHQP